MSVPPKLVHVNMIYFFVCTQRLKQNNCTVFDLWSCNAHVAILTFPYENKILLTHALSAEFLLKTV